VLKLPKLCCQNQKPAISGWSALLAQTLPKQEETQERFCELPEQTGIKVSSCDNT
jgi:hypothetical protein